MERKKDEEEVETTVNTRSVLPDALTGEHAHAPVESCTLASLFTFLMCVCVSLLVSLLCVDACLHVDVRGLCLHCPISYASLLSLFAFESVNA